MESLIIVLGVLLIIAVIIYYIPLPPFASPVKTIAYIILAIVAIIYLLRFARIV